jgi:hypothetical protein
MRHGRKVREKFIQTLATFKIIDQCLERHTGIAKYRFAAKDLRIFYYSAVNASHGSVTAISLSHQRPDFQPVSLAVPPLVSHMRP